jgi:Zinc finger, C3HC4 type (RING finger)/Ankyrin repeat
VAAATTSSSSVSALQPSPTSLSVVKAAGLVQRGESGSGRHLGSEGVLQQRMNPSECFVLDDYLPLDAPYDKDCRAAQKAWLEQMQKQQILQQQLQDLSPSNATLGGRDPWQARGMPHNHHQQQQFGSAPPPPPRRTFLPWSSSTRASRRQQEEDLLHATSSHREATTADFATGHDPRRTTPLHEAARLGHADLVSLMLRHPGADVTERNGEHCTPLHSVAGGVTAEEMHMYQNPSRRRQRKVRQETHLAVPGDAEKDPEVESGTLGIQKPDNVLDPPSLPASQNTAASPRNPHASRLGRILRPPSAAPTTKPSLVSSSTIAAEPEHSASVDPRKLASIESDRRKAALTLLNWSHPDDGSPLSGLGVSVNAVDLSHGRTALHYAAELGRSEICLAISESFGANLTIVDDRGKTPCELAAELGARRLVRQDGQSSGSLAAQLEARALLHVDYDTMGNDDELMATFMSQQSHDADGNRQRLVPPFCWFETRSLPFVQSTRESRLSTAEEKIKELVRLEVQERSACRAMYESDSSDDDNDDNDHVVMAPSESTNATPSSTVEKSPPASAAGSNVSGDGSRDASHRRGDTNETLGSALAYDWLVDPSGVVTESQPRANADDEQGVRALDVCRESEEADVVSLDARVVTPSQDGSVAVVEGSEVNGGDPLSIAIVEKMIPAPGVETPPSSEVLEEAYKGDVKESHTVSTTFSNESNSRIQTSSSAGSTGVLSTARIEASDRRVAETDTDLDPFLNIHKAHVQLFLEAHGWDVHKALSEFVQDSRRAFSEANVVLPVANVLKSENEAATTLECLICCEEFESGEAWTSLESCGHAFCRGCLGRYISSLAMAKSGLVIPCPHHDCQAPLTGYEVASLAPTMDVYEALLNGANEDFVVRASDFTFCSHPSCTGIVQFQAPAYVKNSGMDPTLLHIVGAACTAAHPSTNPADGCRLTYEGVYDPGYTDAFSKELAPKAHRFCFACGDARHHWPVTCEQLSKWKRIVKDQVSEAKQSADGMDSDNYNDVAQELWLKTYTRPCPKVRSCARRLPELYRFTHPGFCSKCKARIEKVDGCNHMICSNPRCKHEFCWICRNDWSLHNTQTGGTCRQPTHPSLHNSR